MTEKSTAKTVQSRPDVERFGGAVRLSKSSGAAAQLNRQRKPRQEGKKEGKREKTDHAREDDAEWAKKKLPLDEAFLDFYIK